MSRLTELKKKLTVSQDRMARARVKFETCSHPEQNKIMAEYDEIVKDPELAKQARQSALKPLIIEESLPVTGRFELEAPNMIEIPKRKLKTDKVREVIKHINQPRTAKELALIVGCSESTVYRAFNLSAFGSIKTWKRTFK